MSYERIAWAVASRLAVSRKSMVAACGIHGSVQISVLPFDPDVSFIDAISVIGPLQVSAAALVQFRPLDLDPDATGVDEQTTFQRHLGHVPKGNRKPQVPPHTPENDIARVVTPFEGVRRGHGQVSPYQVLSHFSHRYQNLRMQ